MFISSSCFYFQNHFVIILNKKTFLAFLREGLIWEDIDWTDNGECLDLIEKVIKNLISVPTSRFYSVAVCP